MQLVCLTVLCVLLCCSRCLCVDYQYLFNGEAVVNASAFAPGMPTTDKVTYHNYQKMYGTFLLPLVEKFSHKKQKMKFLEIGLGCGMEYGPGASVFLWRKLFAGRDVEIWEAEAEAECVEKSKREGKLDDIKVLTGNQANNDVLARWVSESGGKFDVIIDDGGHLNALILPSFVALWPTINPGGYYFIEDLEVSFHPAFVIAGFPPVTVVIQCWIEALHVGERHVSHHHRHVLNAYPLPKGVDMISCQRGACVLHKEDFAY